MKSALARRCTGAPRERWMRCVMACALPRWCVHNATHIDTNVGHKRSQTETHTKTPTEDIQRTHAFKHKLKRSQSLKD